MMIRESSARNKVIIVLFTFLAYLLCYYYTPLYSDGDQEHYIPFYNTINGLELSEAYGFYNNFLGASEPFYFLLTYLASNFGIEKEFFFTLINMFFSFLLVKIFLKHRVNVFVIFSTLINFYFLVLLFSAERLKVALLFFLLSFFVTKKIWKIVLYCLAFFSHFQTALLIYIQVKEDIIDVFKKMSNIFLKVLVFLIIGMIGGIAVFVVKDAILGKILSYLNGNGFLNILKPVVFLVFSMIVSNESKSNIIIKFIPLIIASFFLGEERIVIFCYFLFVALAIQSKKTSHLLVLISALYFMLKGIDFLNKVELYGNGFID